MSDGIDENARTQARRRQTEILALLRAGRQSIDVLTRRLKCPRKVVANDISSLRRQGFTILTMCDISGSYYEFEKLTREASSRRAATPGGSGDTTRHN